MFNLTLTHCNLAVLSNLNIFSSFFAFTTVVCVSSCPSSTDYNEFICFDNVQDESNADTATAWSNVVSGTCMYKMETQEGENTNCQLVFFISFLIATYAALNFCLLLSLIPTVLYRCMYVPGGVNETAAALVSSLYSVDSVPGYSSTSSTWVENFFSMMYLLRGFIFGFGLGVSLLLAFVYLYVLQIPGLLATIIWVILASILVFLCISSWLLWSLANSWKHCDNHSHAEVTLMYVVAYIGIILTFLYICLLIVLRKRINLAIGIVKEAARAMAAMPVILLLPVVQALGIVVFLVPWVIYMLYLASSGEVQVYTVPNTTPAIQYREFTYTTHTKYAGLFMLFCYFWTSQFIVAVGQLIVATSFSCWYFTREKSMSMNSSVFWVKTIIS